MHRWLVPSDRDRGWSPMSAQAALARLRRRDTPEAERLDRARHDKRVRRRLALAWGLLVLNVLTFYPKTWDGQPLAIPIPGSVGKVVTQGALPLALLLVLSVNRRIVIRPNGFLCVVSLLVVGALMAMAQPEHLGTIYRTARLTMFVATLWLFTPWWGRRDMLLVRYYLITLAVVLGVVLLGVPLSPSEAFSQGRLAGTIWPSPPTDVAHFSAVLVGSAIVLWFGGVLSGRKAALIAVAGTAILLLSHTRTALIAMLAGLLVAGLSLVIARARVRKALVAVVVVVAVGAMAFSSVVVTWLARGEGTSQLTNLTGRTSVWGLVVQVPRDRYQVIFGFGLSNKSFNGLPIDSNWLAAYLDLGLFGVVVCAAILIFLFSRACLHPRGTERALALFLLTYCLISSFTETGLSDASPYLIDLMVAASILVQPVAVRPPAVVGAADKIRLMPLVTEEVLS
jgi:O-antigen ligase